MVLNAEACSWRIHVDIQCHSYYNPKSVFNVTRDELSQILCSPLSELCWRLVQGGSWNSYRLSAEQSWKRWPLEVSSPDSCSKQGVCSRCSGPCFSQVMKMSKNGDPTASWALFQYLIMLIEDNEYIFHNWNIPCCNLWLLPLVFHHVLLRRVAPSSLLKDNYSVSKKLFVCVFVCV